MLLFICWPTINKCELQGLVDLDSEIAKCDKKLGLATMNAEKIYKIQSQPGYGSVPESVRESNSEKVREHLYIIFYIMTHFELNAVACCRSGDRYVGTI